MEASVRLTAKKNLLLIATLMTLHTAFAQTAPELVFKNPVLETGVAAQDGAEYRFANITDGMDGLLKIKKRSGTDVVLKNIDLYKDPETSIAYGWEKALQPQVGINGNVPVNKTWWMQFELKFVQTGTTGKKKVKDFVVTSLDVDGDNVSIREFVQMDKVKTLAFSSFTYLKTGTAINTSLLNPMDGYNDGGDHSFNLSGTDKMILGPVTNFTDIDPTATSVMATYTYEDKDAITFAIGATSGTAISNAGMRLNSLWFKAFSLAPQVNLLPLKLESFSGSYAGKDVMLTWKTSAEYNFSHFVVGRSFDGKSFSDIALVFGAGGSSENLYSYKDKNAALPAGVAYYRLRLVDEDRSFSYSPINEVRTSANGKAIDIAVFPNPAKSEAVANLPGAWKGKTVYVKLYNSIGAVYKAKEIHNAGTTVAIDLNGLLAGMYIVEAACDGETAQQRLLKN